MQFREFSPSLYELLSRVADTYNQPIQYWGKITGRRGWFVGSDKSELGSNIFVSYMRSRRLYQSRFSQVINEITPNQVITIANGGLIFGSWAADLGYDVKVIEAHYFMKDFDIPRKKAVKKYQLIPDTEEQAQIEAFKRVLKNLTANTLTTGIVNSIGDYKLGIIEVDEIRPSLRTVVVDDVVGYHFYSALKQYLGKRDVNDVKWIFWNVSSGQLKTNSDIICLETLFNGNQSQRKV